MAIYSEALKKTLENEGGYVNDSSDSGGETFAGISRNNFPLWKGWKIIDSYAEFKNDPKTLSKMLFKLPELSELIQFFYEINFWNVIHGYEIIPQAIANKLFDLAVNNGIVPAVKCLQKALLCEDVDGVAGKETLTKINACIKTEEVNTLLMKFRGQAEARYKSIVIKCPEKKKYLKGWLTRLYEA